MIEEYCKCKYSISPKVRFRFSFLICYLLFLISDFSFFICHLSFPICHRSYKLTKKVFSNELRNEYIKINYYWFNRQEILQKTKEKYSKEKSAEYYAQNKEAIKEKSRERYKNLSQEKKRQD